MHNLFSIDVKQTFNVKRNRLYTNAYTNEKTDYNQ